MRILVLLALLPACDGGGPDEPEGTEDVKVDHTSQDAVVESTAPRSCAAESGAVYVAWQDDRKGAMSVWFNGSDDGGLAWMTADTQINKGEAVASAPDVACDGANVWVVWEDERDGELANHNVYLNRSTDGGRTWLEADVRLDGDVDGAAMSLAPRVVAVGDDVYVVWFDNRDGAYDIYLQASHDGGATWLEEATRVDSDGEGEAYSAWPRLAADGDGNVVVAWEDSRSGASDIYANVSTDGGRTFGQDARLDGGDPAGATDSFLPSVALAEGHAYVVWHDERFGRSDVLINASSDGGATWNDDAARVSSQAENIVEATNPVVAAVGERVHVAWQDDRSGGFDVFVRTSVDGGATWGGEEERMDSDAGGAAQSFDPTVAVRGETVLVSWKDLRDDVEGVQFNDLYYNFSENAGANWSAEDLRINSNKPGSAYAIDATVHLLGGARFAAVWADGRFGSADIFAANRGVGEASVYVPPEEPKEEK